MTTRPFKLLGWPLEIVSRSIARLESDAIPPGASLLTFVFAVALRNYLEIFSDRAVFKPMVLAHFFLFYASLALFITLVLKVTTGTSIVRVFKVVLPCFIVIIIAPIIDLALSSGRGIDISYLEPERHHNLLMRFFTFGGSYRGPGISLGQRIEVALALIGCCFYVRAKGKSWLMSVITAFIIYGAIFLFAILPFILSNLLNLLGYKYRYTDDLFAQSLAVLVFVLLGITTFFANKTYFLAFVRDFRWLRFAHYLLMFAGGLCWDRTGPPLNINSSNFLFLLLVPISLGFASLYSIVTNNLADIEIDRITNPKRPLLHPDIDHRLYRRTAPYFLFLALFYAALMGFDYFFVVAVVIGNYYFYSVRPIRFKRVPILSKLAISVNSLLVIIAGYLVRGGSPVDLDMGLAAVILIGFTLSSNFIDLKDFEGDKKQGIKTLPVLMGMGPAKLLIGLSFIGVYLSVYTLIPDTLLLIGLCAFGVAQLVLINRKRYSEVPVFIVHLLSIATLLGYIIYVEPFS